MPECRRQVSPASAFLPVVSCLSRHRHSGIRVSVPLVTDLSGIAQLCISGPKKVSTSRLTPSNGPRDGYCQINNRYINSYFTFKELCKNSAEELLDEKDILCAEIAGTVLLKRHSLKLK
jgi:hypothetical protein